MSLIWQSAEDPVNDTEQDALSGSCRIGSVLQSGSGRWRWEIVALPGAGGFRDDRSGWCDSEQGAKQMVSSGWAIWLRKASLTNGDSHGND